MATAATQTRTEKAYKLADCASRLARKPSSDMRMLDVLQAFADLTELHDELADAIDDARIEAGWLQDEGTGEWCEPGTDACAIAAHAALSSAYGDMRANEARELGW